MFSDWLVLAVTLERPDLYRINGNRGKGRAAATIRDNAKRHARTIVWGVFDTKGKLIEKDVGPGAESLPKPVVSKLVEQFTNLETVKTVLELLAGG
jgi:hypothetical protein